MKDKNIWPFNGYAPGNYMNKCSICKEVSYNVDKLCFVCLACAVKGAKEIMNGVAPAPPPAGDKMREALRPLANLDLTGVTGDIVYQRDNTQIKVSDVLAAREALSQPPGNDEWVSKPGEHSVFARVEGDCIVIRCGIKDLVFIVENDPEYKYKVHDPVRFAAEMCFEINNSKSFRNNDGMNAAEELFQNAYEKVYEQGNDEVMTGDDCL